LTESATAAGWKNPPSWCMVSEQDNAIPPDAERFMAKRMEDCYRVSKTALTPLSPATSTSRPD
jgi:hypothetical protein